MNDWERRYKTAIEQTEIAMNVNEQLILEKKQLEQQLKEAESVIEFYCHHDDVFGSHGFDISCEACTERPLGKCARQYLAKYKTNE